MGFLKDFLDKRIKDAAVNVVTTTYMEQLAFKELALHIGISYIANALSKCEFKTFEKGKETKGKLYYMLNVSPNPNQNSSQFINQFIEQYFYEGHALIVEHKGYLYCANHFDIDDTNPLQENIFTNVTFGSYTQNKTYKSNEVFYIKLDNKKVKTLVDNLYMQYSTLIDSALKAYKRKNGKKYKLIMEQFQAGDAKARQVYEEIIQKQLQTFVENENAVYPQYKGFDLQEMGINEQADSSDIVSMRKEVFDVTAQALKIPMSMMYGNITNMKEVWNVFLSIAIDPLADMISEEFTRKYYGFVDWKKQSFVHVDTSCINHVDILEVADSVSKAISSGVANIDELRERLNKLPLGTEFSQSYFITKNYMLAEDMLKFETQTTQESNMQTTESTPQATEPQGIEPQKGGVDNNEQE